MKNFIYFLAIAINLLIIQSGNSQVRSDLINDYSNLQRDTLITLMQEYIDTTIIKYHCDFEAQTNNANLDIHSDFDFLPFHRVYLEGMEDFLYLKGYEEFVPLPAWDPITPTPDTFRLVDPDCQNTVVCTYNGFPNPPSNCTTPLSWEPTIVRPSYLNLPGLCNFSFTPTSHTSSPNCCSNGLSRNIETPYHNEVHAKGPDFVGDPILGMRGVMGNFRSPAAPIFWNWHGYVDDIWKEWECNCPISTTQSVDLYLKDNHKVMESWRDRGEEPSFDPNDLIYLSEDIWVRRDSLSGFENDTHKNPQYDTTLIGASMAYVFVRIRNRGCVPSLGTEQLSLHWSKAFLAGVSWPTGWNGGFTQTTPQLLMGEQIDVENIPVIPVGGQVILRFSWALPDPRDYNSESTEPWHFCLLGRVLASNDGMAVNEGPSVADNTRNNNNIAWKNVSIIQVDEINMMAPGAVVGVGNIFSRDAINVFLEFTNDPSTSPVTENAEVTAVLDEELFEVWTRGGRRGTGVEIVSVEERSILILEDSARLENLRFKPFEWGTMKVAFNFLTEEYNGEDEFKFHVVQKTSDKERLTGGELFHVRIDGERRMFAARSFADKETISSTDSVTLSASLIDEPATYEWYNSNGNFIGEGESLTFAPKQSDEYKLRTVAIKDGFIAYSKVKVDVIHNAIKSIAPNPASNLVTVTYDAKSAKAAELRIQSAFSAKVYTYPLESNQNSIKINVNNYQRGIYSVMLIHDDVVVDTKQLSVF